MPIIETLALVLTSETAKSVATFLYEKVEGYVREKFGHDAPDEDELVKFKKEIEDLKNEVESKETDEVTAAEVDELKEKVRQIEQNQTPLPPDTISSEVFEKWAEGSELDVQDKALIVKNQLEVLLNKATELGIRDSKRFQIQDICSSIDVNIRRLKNARVNSRMSPLPEYKNEEERRELLLNNAVFLARDLLKGCE